MTLQAAHLAALPRYSVMTAKQRQLIIRRILRQVAALWPERKPQDPVAWFAANAQRFEQLVAAAQVELVLLAADSTDRVLKEQGYSGDTVMSASPEGFAGATGTGQPVMGLAYAQASKVALTGGAEQWQIAQAWAQGSRALLMATATTLSDTSRLAKQAHLAARQGSGYIRMATPPCCARCAILAGKEASGPWVGFQRHPNCDCDAVPIHDYMNRFGDRDMESMAFDTREYFLSLSTKQQDQIFTKAGAKAIRDGADPAQVVNARRGMTTASDRFGVKTKVTTESTTARGWASQYLRAQYKTEMRKQKGIRYRRTVRPRLMPEEIYRIAGNDRDAALVLLHRNGFLADTSPNLSGRWSWAIRDQEIAAAADRLAARAAA